MMIKRFIRKIFAAACALLLLSMSGALCVSADTVWQADEAETAHGMVVARRSGVICAAVGCGRIGKVSRNPPLWQ